MNFQNSGDQKPGKSKKTWLLIGAAVLLIAAVVTGVILLTGGSGNKEQEQAGEKHQAEEKYEEELLVTDLDTYFSQRGKLLKKIPAAESKNVRDEAGISQDIKDRGFSEYMIMAEYSMDGTIYEAAEIAGDAGTKHPIYTVYTILPNGEYWTLIEVNGTLIANPVSYNLNSGRDVQVVIAETDTMMSYDSHTGLFYETIPDPSALIVIKVDRIDEDMLEKLTAEELGKR